MHKSQFENETETHVRNDMISRRALLIGAGAVGAALASGVGMAAEMAGHDMAGHKHENHAPKNPDVLDAVNHCIVKAQQCSAHCLVAFQEGDLTLADCAKKVNEMLPICKALSFQLAANSPYVKAMSSVCLQACEDCEKECRLHEDKHLECKECAEACAQVVAALKTLAA